MELAEYDRLYELEDHLWWFVGMRAISLSLLDRFLPAREGLRVLDAGCGTGGMTQALGRYGSIVGIDRSPEAIAYARRRAGVTLARGDADRLPFQEATFDLVTSFDVIYHQGVTDDVEALKEARRVLRSGGTLIVRVPAHDRLRSRHDRAVHTRHRYGKKELLTKLHEAGLAPLYVSYANCLLFPLAWIKRMSERRGRSEEGSSEVQAIPAWANRILAAALTLEARILRRSALPLGLSLVSVARKSP